MRSISTDKHVVKPRCHLLTETTGRPAPSSEFYCPLWLSDTSVTPLEPLLRAMGPGAQAAEHEIALGRRFELLRHLAPDVQPATERAVQYGVEQVRVAGVWDTGRHDANKGLRYEGRACVHCSESSESVLGEGRRRMCAGDLTLCGHQAEGDDEEVPSFEHCLWKIRYSHV